MTIPQIINKAKLAPIKTKAIIGTAILIVLLVVALILAIRNNQDIKNEIKIEKITKEKEATEKEVKNKVVELKNDVVKHGEFVNETSKSIINIIDKKPKIKKMNYESTKIKDVSYDFMRMHLDTVQPNE
jgi:polyhydroxyalkanoate synthesis regulator phasin